MRFLIVGSGSREHALAWALSKEAEVLVAPGNAGMATQFGCFNVKASDFIGIEKLAKDHHVDCVLIGPEQPLIDGLADRLRMSGIAVFGPGAAEAQLEGSKAFSKNAMREAGVPTAEYQIFTNPAMAVDYAQSRFDQGMEVAVKASGNALGKGVVVCSDSDMAEDAIRAMLVDGEFGEAGRTIVLEDRLFGREFSLIALVSRGEFKSFPACQDYKRALDFDRGPNTGGMGSVCPPNWLDPETVVVAEQTVVAPILKWMLEHHLDFRGALFAGLLVQDGKPYCLEYNVRFGDPETQSLMLRTGTGIADSLLAVSHGLPIPRWEVHSEASATVVIASGGYPGKFEIDEPIEVGELPKDVELFWGGVQGTHEGLRTSGGRVVSVSATGDSIETARSRAYDGVRAVQFSGSQFRTDIGSEQLVGKKH